MTRKNQAEYNKAYRAANSERLKEQKRAYYLANKEKINAKHHAYREANKEKLNEQSRKYRHENKEKLNKQSRDYHEKNAVVLREKMRIRVAAKKTERKEYLKNNKEKLLPAIIKYQTAYYESNREKLLQSRREYVQLNPEKLTAQNAKRKAARLQRTPNWLTKKDYAAIELFYAQAKAMSDQTGEKYHVDHIIPLRGKKVSGLHVPTNLQVISAKVNLKKKNHYDVSA
jgi:hypothetical protein